MRLSSEIGNEHFFPDIPSSLIAAELDDLLGEEEAADNESDVPCKSKRLRKCDVLYDPNALVPAEQPQFPPGDMSPKSRFIKRGTKFDVISFLPTHLFRNNNSGNDCVVNVGSLEGKVVMICCFFVPASWSSTDSMVARAVSLVSSEMYVFGAFELVVVAKMRRDWEGDEAAFNHFMSGFPSSCLIVPFREPESRDSVCRSLNLTSSLPPVGVLINRNQMVEWHNSLNTFTKYGVDGFPFTPERLTLITERDGDYASHAWKEWSLNWFLSSNPLPYPSEFTTLRKNPGGGPEKTCIYDLVEKRVGLYLCYTGQFIPTLDKIYNECCDRGLEFEIVLVYLPFKDSRDPRLFQDTINRVLEKRKISWWVLPFVNWVSRRLWRLCRLCHKDIDDDRLFFIDSKSNLVELHGDAVIRQCGISAYPFSRERLIQRELERLREVTLESLLVHGSRDYVVSYLGGIGDVTLESISVYVRVPVAALRGRNILLYLDHVGFLSSQIYDLLIESYGDIKASGFEVVFVGLGKSSTTSSERIFAMPWLVCPFDSAHSKLVSKKIFREVGIRGTLVAFGEDSHILSIRAQQLIHSYRMDLSAESNLRNEIIADFGNLHLPQCCI